MTKKQAEERDRYTIMDAEDRKQMIYQHLEMINHNACDSIAAFGLSVAKTFMRVPARQLQPPLLEYRDCKTIQVKCGEEWPMNFRCDEMEVLTSASTSFKWAILNTDPHVLLIKLKQFAKGVRLIIGIL